jgi:DMSO/TMAO reductase YedYZ molybdopterin-dependent catalytic subunit
MTSIGLSRRAMLRACLGASLGRWLESPAAAQSVHGRLLGVVPFVDEGRMPAGVLRGSGLDGRLALDLATVSTASQVTPVDRFYVRTREPDRIDRRSPWAINLRGPTRSLTINWPQDLEARLEARGAHVMECAGNDKGMHFGLISAAQWTGVPIVKLLEQVATSARAEHWLIGGRDDHSRRSRLSIPGASWIFSLDQLATAGAFLATRMNGQPLTPDHGHPVRLVVPGWYGCVCIKWVNEIKSVSRDAQATAQMREFASRTSQDGIPDVAREYKPATMDLAAMAVRVERWSADTGSFFRVAGILWGGDRATDTLTVRFRPDEPYVPVEHYDHRTTATWTLWEHTWRPKAPGRYGIQLAVADRSIRTRRLDQGHYVRSVVIDRV